MTKAPTTHTPKTEPLSVITVRIDEIRPPYKQIRSHPKKKIAALAKQIKANGYIDPLLLGPDMRLIDGGGRLEGLKANGATTVQAIQLHHVTPAQARALRVAINKSQEGAQWLETLQAELAELTDLGLSPDHLNISEADLEAILAADLDEALRGQAEPASVQIPSLAISRPGDIWRLGEHRLGAGDTRDPAFLEQLTDGEMADAGVIDPPYGCAITGHVSGRGAHRHREFLDGDGAQTPEKYSSLLEAYFKNAMSLLRPGAYLYSFSDWRQLRLHTEQAEAAGFIQRDLIVWMKTNGSMGGHYRQQHECLLFLQAGKGKAVNNVRLGKFGRNRTNVWQHAGANVPGELRKKDHAVHPTPKPVALISDAILDSTCRHDTVLDLFAGAGTTMIAAQKTKRRAILNEIDPLYVDAAIARYRQAFNVEAIHAATGRTFDQIASERSSAPRVRTRARPGRRAA